MKKYIPLLLTLVLCGCSVINTQLLGKCPCNNARNYMDNVSTLQSNIEKYIGVLPPICEDIKRQINTDTPDINALLNYLKVDKTTGTKAALAKYEQLRACANVYNRIVESQKDIEASKKDYYEKQQDLLCPTGCFIAMNIDKTKNVFFDFKELYDAYLVKINSPLAVKNPKLEIDRFSTLATMLFNYYYDKEAAIFKSKTGGLNLCAGSVSDFMLTTTKKSPIIYSNSKYTYFLSVLSTGYNGVLVSDSSNAPYNMFDKMIFVYTKDKYATSSPLKSGYYSYRGIYDYTTVMGYLNSVHSFKAVDINKLLGSLLFYKYKYEISQEWFGRGWR